MKEVTRRIALDLTRKNNTRVSFASQADFGSREFIISLLDDGVPYPVDKSLTATVNVCRPDGTSTAYMAEITDDGCVRYVAGLWALRIPGDTRFSVSLYDGDDRKLTTSYFTVNVEAGLHLGTDILEGDATHTAFTDMMNTVAHFKGEEIKRDAAERERINNEGIRTAFELERAGNERDRQAAEKTRDNRELDRMMAESVRADNEALRIKNENARLEVTATLKSALYNLLTLQQIYIERGELV